MNCARSSPPTARGRWPGWCSSCPTSGSAQPKYLSRAESWVRKLDAQAEGSEKQFFTYAVQNRRAQELVEVLQSMFANETGAGRSGAPTRTVAPQYREATAQSRNSSPSPSGTFGAGGGFGSGGISGAGSASIGGGMGSGKLNASFGQQRSPQALASASGDVGGAASGSTGMAQIGQDEGTGEPRVKIAADQAKNAV